MSPYVNMPVYTPGEVSIPTKSLQNTPISTQSRLALLKPKLWIPIKFLLSKPESTTLKELEFDWDAEDSSHGSRVSDVLLYGSVLLWLTWSPLIPAAVYLYSLCPSAFNKSSVEYISTAALSVLR